MTDERRAEIEAQCETRAVQPHLVRELLAEVERLREELRLWKPMTPEEAERALDAVEAVPLSEERIAEIVKRATDPAERVNNSGQAQMAAHILRIQDENRDLRRLADELASRQESFADPVLYPQCTDAERRMFRHAASLMRQVAAYRAATKEGE